MKYLRSLQRHGIREGTDAGAHDGAQEPHRRLSVEVDLAELEVCKETDTLCVLGSSKLTDFRVLNGDSGSPPSITMYCGRYRLSSNGTVEWFAGLVIHNCGNRSTIDGKKVVLPHARRGIKNDSIDIIELSKGFQPIAIVSISKKKNSAYHYQSMGNSRSFTIHRYPRTTI
jgi:hypothetical protein